MKKKLLAIIAAIAMVAALLVPMWAVSANTEKTVVFEIGEVAYNAEYGEIEVPLNIVENNSDIYSAQIYLESEQGLECTYITKGTIKDSYDAGREGIVEYGFDYTLNREYALAVLLSGYDNAGVSTTGLVATFSFKLPEGKGEADIDEFTFKFGAETMLVAFDDSRPTAVLKEEEAPVCQHTNTKEVVTKEAEIGVAGSMDIVCEDCGEVLETKEIPALEKPVDPDAKQIIFEIGEIAYNAEYGEIEVPLNIVENNSDIYSAQIYLESEQGLECTYITKGTIKDSYDAGREGIVEYGFDYTLNRDYALAVLLSGYDSAGVSTTGLVATFSFKLPEGKGEADIDEFTFKFGAETMLVAFDDTRPVAVLKKAEAPEEEECTHAETKEVVTKEATCTEAGSKNIVCVNCNEVVKTEEIEATGHITWQPDPENNVDPTCTEAGKIAYKCTCGETKFEAGAAALNHPEEERKEVVTKEAEIGVAGSKDIVCGLCDTVLETKEIPALEKPVDPDAKQIIFEIGEIAYNAEYGEIEVPLNIVENNSDIYSAQIYLESEQGLECTYITKGTIKDSYDAGREGIVEYGFDYTLNRDYALAVLLSGYDSAGISTTGLVATFSFKLPEGKGEADIDEFTFKFGAETMLVAFDDTRPVAVLKKADAPEEEECTHEATKEVVTKEATCTEAGSKDIVCTVCDEVIKTEEIKALGHGATKEVVTKAATCTEAGSKDIVCTVCDEVIKTEEIKALGHGATKEVVTKAATCTEAGSKDIVCTVCDEVIKTEEIKALGHGATKEVVTKEATCTEAGSKDIVCTVCDEVIKTEEIKALGHGATKEVVTKEATCTEAGSKNIVCTVCDEVIKTEEIKATGHAYESDQTQGQAPDCVNDGKVVDVCANCGDVEETVIPKLGHDFNGKITIVKEATAEAEGSMTIACTRCDEVKEAVIPKLVNEVKDKFFSVKTEDDKFIPADTAPVPAELDKSVEAFDKLEIITGLTFASETSAMDLKEIAGEIVIDVAELLKSYNNVTFGVINAEGKLEKVEVTIKDGKATFNGALGATYVVMGEEIVEEEKPTTSDKTSDNFSAVLYIAVALIAAAGVVVITKKRIAL